MRRTVELNVILAALVALAMTHGVAHASGEAAASVPVDGAAIARTVSTFVADSRPQEWTRSFAGIFVAREEIAVGTLAAANDAELQGALAALLRGAASRNQIDRTVDADGAARWIAAIIDGIFSRVAVDPGFKPKDEGAMLRLLLTRFLRPQG